MSLLEVSFFGAFQVKVDGAPIPHFRSVNTQGLLAYLILQAERPFPRDVLAALFWPDETDSRAKKNLRQTLYQLRQLLADSDAAARPFLFVSRQSIQWHAESDYWLDVQAFLADLARGDLETAVDHYQGELLPGFTCNSLEFENWLRLERERLHRLALTALADLTERQIAQADFAAAQASARRQLALEPWREAAHRQLMRALARIGDRRTALAQFELCQKVLAEELGAPPAAETVQLAAQIESGALAQPEAASLAGPSAPFQAPPTPPHFVGREAALAELADLIASQRVVALVGMGGIGKSSLATAVAHRLRFQFADGVLWANPHASDASNVLALWARVYDHDFSALTDLASRETAVRSLLADKQTLIMLDNVEDAAEARPLLLHGARGAALLTTRSLDVAAALNAHAYVVSELSAASSQALLVEILGAERVLGDPAEAAAADQIGNLLHHLPLAVEIAAQRLKSRPRLLLAGMAQRLQDTQRRLGLSISDSAVRASFAVSWDGLDSGLQALFAQLGVFAGRPFTPEALAAVADRDLDDTEDDLYMLAALSLVSAVGDARYRQHPLLADFAAEKLGEDAGVNGRFVGYYLDFARINGENLAALEPEWENLAAAVTVAHAQQAWQAVLDLTAALRSSWFRYGRYHDAHTAYALAETAATALPDEGALAHTLLAWAEVEIEQSRYAAAGERLETAVDIFHRLEDGIGLAQSTYFQGCILFDQGLFPDAEKQLQQSLAFAEELADLELIASVTDQLARVYFELDDESDRAQQLASDALRMHEAIGNLLGQAKMYRLLANIEIRNQNLAQAEKLALAAKAISQRLQDPIEKGMANYLLVAVYSMQEAYAEADPLAQESLKIFRQRGNKRYEAMIMNELSLNYLALGQPEKSLPMTQQILQIYRQIEERLGFAYAMRHLGDIYRALGDPAQSRAAWLEAKQIGEFLNHAHLLGQLEKRLGP